MTATLESVAKKIDAGTPLTTAERIWTLGRLGVDIPSWVLNDRMQLPSDDEQRGCDLCYRAIGKATPMLWDPESETWMCPRCDVPSEWLR